MQPLDLWYIRLCTPGGVVAYCGMSATEIAHGQGRETHTMERTKSASAVDFGEMLLPKTDFWRS